MNKKKIIFFRKMLEGQKYDLLKEAERTIANMINVKENFPDPTDRAVLEANRNFLLRIRDRERKLLSKIHDSLQRTENGTYGICESCGEEINEERLIARPVTTLCFDCKNQQEATEKDHNQ